MTRQRQEQETEERASPLETPQSARKPYHKPAVRYEQVFETSALACGKIGPTQSSCIHARKRS